MVHDSTMAIVHHFTGWWGSRKTPNCFRMPVDSAHCLTKSLWNLRDGVSRLVLSSAGIRKENGRRFCHVGFVRLFKSFRKSYLRSSWQELMLCCADDSDCSGSGQAIWIHLYIYISISFMNFQGVLHFHDDSRHSVPVQLEEVKVYLTQAHILVFVSACLCFVFSVFMDYYCFILCFCVCVWVSAEWARLGQENWKDVLPESFKTRSCCQKHPVKLDSCCC